MDNPDRIPSWEDLRLFLAIVRSGTLTGAAVTVQVSQPTLGRRLQALEALYGQPLLQRTTKGYVPTEAGQIVVDHAQRMEDETLTLSRQLQGGNNRLRGMLRLSSSEWFARHVLTPWVVSFNAVHPEVVVELMGDTRFVSLDRREADIIFRFTRFEEPEVVQRLFMKVEYVACASVDYLARQGQPSLGDGGEGHRIVTMNTAYGSMADVVWISRMLPAARMALRSNSRDVQAEACVRGAGVAVLPKVMASSLGLVELDLGEPPPGRDVFVGYHPDLKTMPRLRALLDYPLSG